MFRFRQHNSLFSGALTMAELIFHSVVRGVREKHNNAFIALGKNMLQAVMFLAAFYLMFILLGVRGAGLRGDMLMYMMSGIFLYLINIKAVGAVLSAEGPTGPMMKHVPMNTIISISSSALSVLYTNLLTIFLILFAYHVLFNKVEIEDPVGAFGMLLLAWFVGCAVGVVLLSLKPWFPTTVSILSMVYKRANMIASGKMFVANALPGYMLVMFDWNPLFHAIDQCRGFVFRNYFPRVTSWEYAFWVGVVLVMIGLMGEFFTRRHVSVSWFARR